METKKWYVGQQVWDLTISDEAGEIISINDVQLVAKFFRNQWAYSLNGELIIVGRNQPTLSTKPYEIKMEGFSQEVQEELPKKGHICWGRRQKSVWFIGHFIEKKEGEYILSPDIEGINSKYYDEITTKNPYEAVEDREPKIGDMVFAWSDLKYGFVYGELQLIESSGYPYIVKYHGGFKHCSLKNPLIK